jgi:hypothetical protein
MATQLNATSIALNRAQNNSDFELEPIEEAPTIFKKGFYSKTLDPPKNNPEKVENFRIVTIKCLIRNCK